MQRRFLLAIYLIAFLVTLAAFSPTLNLPFAGDDLDHLRTVGAIRSGQISSLRGLMMPFNEQTLLVERLFYLGATYLSGLDGALTLRLMLAVVHSVGAVFCGLIVYRYSGSRIATLVTVITFSAAAGFSGSVISAPACGIFLLGLSFVTIAIYALAASPLRGWSRFFWSLLAFVIAGLGMNGTAALAVTLVILAIWSRDEPVKRRWLMAAGFAVAGLAILWAAHWNLGLRAPVLKFDWNAVNKFGWIVYTAPLRFLCTWLPGLQDAITHQIARENTSVVHVAAAGSVIVALASTRLLERNQRKLLFALLAGVLALTLLVAVGRAQDSNLVSYMTNRYYHFFLLPFAAATGFVANSLLAGFGTAVSRRWKLTTGCVLLGLSGFAIYSSAINAWQWVHHGDYAAHGRAITAAKQLVRLIELEARSTTPPTRIELLDGEIPFAGIRTDTIALRTLWFTEYPRGIKNVVIKSEGLSDEDIARENELLNRWAQMQGRDSNPVQASRKGLIRPLPWQIDFRKDGFDNAIVSGLYQWGSGSRWLSASGIVRLKPGAGDFMMVGNVPPGILNRLGRQTIGVRILLNNVELGRAEFTGSPEDTSRFAIPADLRNSIDNLEEVTVTLQSDVAWIPKKLQLNMDERTLSVSVIAIGFATAAGQTGNER